jgi:hypothetical protein
LGTDGFTLTLMPSGQHLGRHGTVSESVTVYFGNSFNRFLKTSKRFIAGCFMAYRWHSLQGHEQGYSFTGFYKPACQDYRFFKPDMQNLFL